MKHTPGPWTFRLNGGDFVIETQPHGEDVAVIHSTFGGTNDDNANARLIAAAPDMLAALRAVQMWSWELPLLLREHQRMQAVDAPIAKAEGR